MLALTHSLLREVTLGKRLVTIGGTMYKRVLWEMNELDAQLLEETLVMDSRSHAFEAPLRRSIAGALKRVKMCSKATYDALKKSEGRLIQVRKTVRMVKKMERTLG
jgi:hypothetical protein